MKNLTTIMLSSIVYDECHPKLYIYSSPQEAAQKEEGLAVVEDNTKFFTADGSPLEVLFSKQPYIDTDKNVYFAGEYTLVSGSGKNLQDILLELINKNPSINIFVNEKGNNLLKSCLKFFPKEINSRIKIQSSYRSNSNNLRIDLKVIVDMILPNTKVLDIGCGDGELLKLLKDEKQAFGRGLELDQTNVSKCLANGVSVVQGDVNTDLEHYPADSFDYTILTQTLQVTKHPDLVLNEMLRIGRQAIVGVPNFGYWRNRLQLLLDGKMPVTKKLSYQWYETPNIHFCTIKDFIALCRQLDIKIKKRLAISPANKIINVTGNGTYANIFGEQGVFLLSR